MEAISNLHIYSKTHSHKLPYANGSDTKILSEHLHYRDRSEQITPLKLNLLGLIS